MAYDWQQQEGVGQDAIDRSDDARNALAATFMNRVFSWMAAGLTTSGLVAWLTMSNEGLYNIARGLYLPIMIVQLVMVIAISAGLRKFSATTAGALFIAYSALMGVTLGLIVSMYTGASVANVFFVTAGTFTAMSVIGATTKRDLSNFGGMLMMGVIAIIIASVVNIFLNSSGLQFAVSIIGVLIFTGLTAVDSQRFRKMGYMGFADERQAGQMAIHGALNLYLDFINMFLFMLRIFGGRR